MAARRAITPSLRCSHCRIAFLRTCSATFGIHIEPAALTTASRTRFHAFRTTKRSFSRCSAQPSQASHRAETIFADPAIEEIGEGELPGISADSSTADDSLPWYLQIQDDEAASDRRFDERQQLPDLPPESPPLLQTLLEHISVDIGLDDVSLLDLRHLNPPSALGANLIMLVGTARSEKHLHVSADRFCRYLRSEHKLQPHADGLLGRGELKIRMRRRAKRIKILAHAGALDTRTLEEEMRTGWVCVMVDGLEPAPGWTSAIPRRNDFIGFDERSNKITLVVQMFTEAKRNEVELEKLWARRSDGVLKSSEDEGEEEDRNLDDFRGSLRPSETPKPVNSTEHDIFEQGLRALKKEPERATAAA